MNLELKMSKEFYVGYILNFEDANHNKKRPKAVPRGPPIWIWILVFPKITKEFLYFFLLEKIQITRKPSIGVYPGLQILGKPNLSTNSTPQIGGKNRKSKSKSGYREERPKIEKHLKILVFSYFHNSILLLIFIWCAL